MNALLWSSAQAFGFSLILTPIFRDIFRSYKVVDQPDQNRKVHIYPIPRVGGIAIAIAYVLAFYLARPDGPTTSRELSLIENVLPSAALIFFTGLIDDFFNLKPWQKLSGQMVAACLAWWAGVRISWIGGYAVPDAWGFLLTIGWLLLCTNAFNLVDGLDGLAAGVGMFATLTIFASAAINGNQPLMFATLPLAGCLLGFLCFNFNPATVFLGDCGSLLIGFLLGCFGAIWTDKSMTLIGLTAPLMAVSVPLLDVLLCIVRRWLRHQPIFSPDRGHIHHKLIDRGLSPRQAVLLLYGLCGVAAICSVLQTFLNNVYVAVGAVAVFVAVVWMAIHYLRYAEFMLAGQMLRTGEFQRSVNARVNLSSFEKAIARAGTWDECWETILAIRGAFGIAALRLQIAGRTYECWEPAIAGPQYWTIRAPISDNDYVEMAREYGSPVVPMAMVPFTELLVVALSEKMREFAVAESNASASPAIAMQMQAGN
jgi:UDP-GlcNAc:undecaprenyl-phosphate/decaprenyl-phosphate GlcNAc-1-phosphate transferase